MCNYLIHAIYFLIKNNGEKRSTTVLCCAINSNQILCCCYQSHQVFEGFGVAEQSFELSLSKRGFVVVTLRRKPGPV